MTAADSLVVGIDLGTTNSEIAAWVGDRVRVLGPGAMKILPSCVGVSPEGEVLVGEPARNQYLLHPERTARSVKRKMGSGESVTLGEQTFTPQEISALILRTLAGWAQQELGRPAARAVITVPAYFSDAQRQATREAGELAGLEVLRILNEPTAASLDYGYGAGRTNPTGASTVLIYDLGGGTFDVSLVHLEGNVTEVLASHGNNRLGGDDFDELLVEKLAASFEERHGVDLRSGRPAAWARLVMAAEEAKKKLSDAPYAPVREEHLAEASGVPLHLDLEIARADYEEMIRPLVESTLDSVSRAMDDAGKKAADLDALILVGGATRTPLIARLLEEHVGLVPRQEVHPDLCVALGAGVLATRLAGGAVDRVLVDVSPYSFGPSHIGDLGGRPYAYCYRPLIRRNTPLPATRSESYYTASPYQSAVEIEIFQGDDPDALKNVPVGEFRVEGLTRTPEPSEILCRMSLDLDGILQVAAIEKSTGKSKQITISRALERRSPAEIADARRRLAELHPLDFDEAGSFFAAAAEEGWSGGDEVGGAETAEDADGEPFGEPFGEPPSEDPVWDKATRQARRLQDRSRQMLAKMHDDDQEEAIDLSEAIESAIARGDLRAVTAASADLDELLFFVEGK